MTNREQLEAEAEELYPITKALDVDHTAIVIAHRSAHIRAKTVSADGPEVEVAAGIFADVTGEPRAGRFERTMAEAALSAAGLYVEAVDE